MAVGDVVPELPLLDQFGKPVSLHAGGLPTIVSFAFTRCPDPRMCDLVTAKFARLQLTLRGSGIHLIEVTLDPSFDRPAVLRRYAAAAGARASDWQFVTGRLADVVALSTRFGIQRERRANGTFLHSDAVAIVSGTGVVEDIIDGNAWSVGDVAALARQEAGLTSNPFARFALAMFAGASAICGGRGGGIPLAGTLAIFAILTAVLSLLAVRIFAAALFDWS